MQKGQLLQRAEMKNLYYQRCLQRQLPRKQDQFRNSREDPENPVNRENRERQLLLLFPQIYLVHNLSQRNRQQVLTIRSERSGFPRSILTAASPVKTLKTRRWRNWQILSGSSVYCSRSWYRKKETAMRSSGERRWRAARKAGLTEIPAIVREYTDQETLELSLIENIQREDLNPIEEAKAFRRLVEEFSLRQEDLAVRVSKSRTAITNSLRLLKLDERVQDMIVQGQISMGHARALIPVEIPEEQYLIAQQIAEKHLSVRDVEKLIKARLSGKKKKKDSGKDKTAERDPALELAYKEIEERLKQSLGTKTTIRHSGDGTGKLEIEFYSHEDLEKIVDMLT